MSEQYSFDIEYFELPFTTDLSFSSKKELEEVHTITYVRKCTKGWMVFSNSHKHFLYAASKKATQLVEALGVFIADKTKGLELVYTLTEKGSVLYAAKAITDGRYWVEDITGFSFMDATWNGASVTEASNPFLTQGAKGESKNTSGTHEETTPDPSSSSKRSTKQS